MQDKANGDVNKLFNTVIAGNYCSGCGVCAYVNPNIRMDFDEYGQIRANINNIENEQVDDTISILSVCPFSNESPNEDVISNELYGSIDSVQYDKRVGYYLGLYGGFVNEGDYRKNGSSGGIGTWIFSELFRRNLIDGVIHVKENNQRPSDSTLFNFQISRSIKEIQSGAKTRYYPVEMSEVLNLVKHNPGKYAIIGISCFIKAVRALAQQDSDIRESIKYTIGLICGHQKSSRFSDFLAWESGIQPGGIKSIDFRKKLLDKPSYDYGVEVVGLLGDQEITRTKRMIDVTGKNNWGHGFFKGNCCDYCDDVLNETSDMTIGDAWLPEYQKDSMGNNVVIVRNPVLNQIIQDGIRQERLSMHALPKEKVIETQLGNFRHRQDEIGFRLQTKDELGEWRPKKRFEEISAQVPSKRKSLQLFRMRISRESHHIFKNALEIRSLIYFKNEMNPLIKMYDEIYFGHPRWVQTCLRGKAYLKAGIKKVLVIAGFYKK